MNIALTGATGFVGGAILKELVASKLVVLGRTRPSEFNGVFVPFDINQPFDVRDSLKGVDVVVHCAARVHVMRDVASEPLLEFRRSNVEGTLRLAEQAAQAGVRRFIFISSIKVNGESTTDREPFTVTDAPAPADAYGISKAEAELALFRVSRDLGMDVVVIRPPLIYGPGVKANFAALLRLAKSGLPLPLGSATNLRSFVAVDNLVDLVMLCLSHPSAANQVFLVSDGHDLSTAELLKTMAVATKSRTIVFPFPVWLLKGACVLLGAGAIADRLFGSLQVDISHTTRTLGWRPKLDFAEGIKRMTQQS